MIPTRQALSSMAGGGMVLALLAVAWPGDPGVNSPSPPDGFTQTFQDEVRPLLTTYCLRCHNADEMMSGVRVDFLDGTLEDRQLFLLKDIRRQLSDEAMPPEDEPQPPPDQRQRMIDWIDGALSAARTRDRERNGAVRRLTNAQYRNTLRDLLGLDEEVTGILPAEGTARSGFVNNGEESHLSPLQIEAYFEIAERALNLCIVDETRPPVIQSFRVDLGRAINPEPCPDELVLGALSHLLPNDDFIVTEQTPDKPFRFEPFRMRTRYRFIEGYQGNDTVREWRDFDGIYHAVFACLRGAEGYPKGDAARTVPEGLLLRPAIPSDEVFNVDSTYGPKANFKISLRELPDGGRFRVTVTAARYDDGLLLEPGAAARPEDAEGAIVITGPAASGSDLALHAGIYQVDLGAGAPGGTTPPEKPPHVTLVLGGREFSGELVQPAFLIVRVPEGSLHLQATLGEARSVQRIQLTPLAAGDPARLAFERFEQRRPRLGVHLGLRRDCGSTLNPVGPPQAVASIEPAQYVFEGAINNFPSPDVEDDNVNYLAGIREIGVRSEYTDGRDMPRLLIRSVEFEGPLYDAWPPASHRRIFIESDHRDDPEAYAREVIASFASRAFRRPVPDAELAPIIAVWADSFQASGDFQESVKSALVVVLTSPQFLFLIEESASPEPEPLDPYELAAGLSYFLWNTAPDEELLRLAASGDLVAELDAQITRMVADRRFEQFVGEFGGRWLSLDKFDVVAVDAGRFPALHREVRARLRREPIEYLQHLIRQNRPLAELVRSDYIVADEVVAAYYGLGNRTDGGFEFGPIPHDDPHLGGVLSQAAVLAGLSNGRESHPVKRGAWLARKIIAEPPDDPPPNVPALPEDEGSHLTLRQKLERHRDQPGCAECHRGIDPWGLPLEEFDAAGRFRTGMAIDARAILPDGTEVADAAALKAYLAEERIDQVAFSFLEHLSMYLRGRSLTYHEIEFLRENGLQLRDDDYRMQDLIRWLIHSDLFQAK